MGDRLQGWKVDLEVTPPLAWGSEGRTPYLAAQPVKRNKQNTKKNREQTVLLWGIDKTGRAIYQFGSIISLSQCYILNETNVIDF